MNTFDDLELHIIPIPAVEKAFTVSLEQLYPDKGSLLKALSAKQLKTSIIVKRRGPPLVPAYSITTHKSQGQTLPKIIIDLNMPPGMVEVASSYVPLSRVKQLADIAILRDFDISALRIKPSKGQIEELSRLSAIFGETKRRYSHYFT
jgi:ATP-dependent exoDNAse (exonuclease V) alpha subunit